MTSIQEVSWPAERAGEAIQILARYARLPLRSEPLPSAPLPVRMSDQAACHAWLESTAAFLGVDAERRAVTYSGMAGLPPGPALLGFNSDADVRFLAIFGLGRGKLILFPPDSAPIRTTVEPFIAAIAGPLESKVMHTIAPILTRAGVVEESQNRAARVILEDRIGNVHVAELWTLAMPVSGGWWKHATALGLPKTLVGFLAAYTVEYGLWVLAWAVLGRWAIEGRYDRGWLTGWALLLLTVIPVHLLALRQQAELSIRGGWLMMRFLLEGSFRLKPEEVRYQGVGQLLGRVLDSEALQSFALSGGLSSAVTGIQLVAAFGALGWGGGAWNVALLLAGWAALTGVVGSQYYRRRRDWTNARLDVTQVVTERMIGHRTRLAQELPAKWHQGEDEIVGRYVDYSRRADRWNITSLTLLPQGWLIAGFAALAPAIVAGTESTGKLAIDVGAILLGYTALRGLASAFSTLTGAAIALERSKEFFVAAGRTEPPGDPGVALDFATNSNGNLLEMREVAFRYPQRAVPAVAQASIKIRKGDRVLLKGPSGGGKSTWVALASGIRVPDSGLLFLRGVDRQTLGDRGWRRHIAAAPQFHENHIFSGSLAYNLLLGRGWPAESNDLAEAETVCRELGLGPLLDSMPAGLMQMVGDAGWQLSNGEKSRVYLARTLMQRTDMIILDETFASLDPETAQQAMECVLRRAPTLVCVAHV